LQQKTVKNLVTKKQGANDAFIVFCSFTIKKTGGKKK